MLTTIICSTKCNGINQFLHSHLEAFEVPKQVLLLKQLLYGLKYSPLKLYNNLYEGLEDKNLAKSYFGDYLFTNRSVMIIF